MTETCVSASSSGAHLAIAGGTVTTVEPKVSRVSDGVIDRGKATERMTASVFVQHTYA